ncbi:MAG: SURF1 family protein [Pseudomonadota bacterium]|nr:SURF1 family protein [Pseudomonadota bacterium]
MKKLTHNKLTYKNFSDEFIKILFFLLVIFVCSYLGLWQIERGNQKIIIYEKYIKNLEKDPIIVKKLDNKFKEFIKLRVFGEFILGKQFLLDNSIVNRKAGYKVLTPYKVDKKIVLVDRGWIEKHFDKTLPEVSITKPSNFVDGYVFYHKNLLELDKSVYKNQWPKIIQNIKIEEISTLLNLELEPYILVMYENQNNSYINNRKYKKNAELKHFMYAGQWFLFSVVAFIFMIILLRKESNSDEKTK